jgi:hypothetical protein
MFGKRGIASFEVGAGGGEAGGHRIPVIRDLETLRVWRRGARERGDEVGIVPTVSSVVVLSVCFGWRVGFGCDGWLMGAAGWWSWYNAGWSGVSGVEAWGEAEWVAKQGGVCETCKRSITSRLRVEIDEASRDRICGEGAEDLGNVRRRGYASGSYGMV